MKILYRCPTHIWDTYFSSDGYVMMRDRDETRPTGWGHWILYDRFGDVLGVDAFRHVLAKRFDFTIKDLP